MADDDLVMESTTDSPEQIAAGLGVPVTPETPADPVEGDEPTLETASEGDELPTEGDEPVPAEPAPADVTTHPAKGVTAKTAKPAEGRPQRKAADSAAAAARRKADARAKVLEDENTALRERLNELALGRVASPKPAAVSVPVTITADQIPETHPRVAAIVTQITALGAKPKQGDFDDFEKFEDAKDAWIENRARLRARVETVREDVARQETIATDEANRAAAETKATFEASVADAEAVHADYDEVMATAREDGLIVSTDVGTALMESTHGAHVLYYLAQHPDEVERLNGLSPHRQIAEVGMLEGRIAATLRPRSAAPARPGVRTTRAPEPQRSLVGDLPSRGRSREERMNDSNISQAEYNRIRNEMDVESGRRTH